MQFNVLIQKLCSLSIEEFMNPGLAIDWPDLLEPNQWFMPPELISIQGLDVYEHLSEEQKYRLSFFELINFFSLNIHGEKALVSGISDRLYEKHLLLVTPYLHHFLDEENKHMQYFGTFCLKYADKIYEDRKIVFPREYFPGEELFLFFAKILIFEELVDWYNRLIAKDMRVHAVVRRINQIHHDEESRHLSFGKSFLKQVYQEYASAWPADYGNVLLTDLEQYFMSVFREYFNPSVYEDAGLSDVYVLSCDAFESVFSAQMREKISAKIMKNFEYLRNNLDRRFYVA